ncbi:MAG: hypothetical protein ACLQVD_03905 [Capsulimonadaceae bacterium]
MALTLIGEALIRAVVVWLRRRRAGPYDLEHLNDPPFEPQNVPDQVDDDSGPYCPACDEAHPAGTNFCRSCGRKL